MTGRRWLPRSRLMAIAPGDQVVLLAGPPLGAEATLVAGRMLGGKVHGPLARAGKARGRTPKMAKQEKKKTGRAKRQMQDD
ncbi:hypothetical protein GH733_003383 [Mirounga leonina]|nr:hypothetical protein GH733_003383 [Mirounga leonina]